MARCALMDRHGHPVLAGLAGLLPGNQPYIYVCICIKMHTHMYLCVSYILLDIYIWEYICVGLMAFCVPMDHRGHPVRAGLLQGYIHRRFTGTHTYIHIDTCNHVYSICIGMGEPAPRQVALAGHHGLLQSHGSSWSSCSSRSSRSSAR